MQLLADVVVAARHRLAGVQPDAHAHGTRRGPGLRRQCLPCGQRRGDRIAGHAEHGEERIALGVDLMPAVRGEGLAQQLAVRLLCAWMETALGDLSAAVRWWGAVITSCDALEDEPWTLSVALVGLAATLHVMGRHADALRVASRFMALPSQRDTTLAMTSILAVEVAPVLVGSMRPPTGCCATPCAMHGASAS